MAGIQQQLLAQASPDGNVKLLVLPFEESEELFHMYPEDHEQIMKNLMHNLNLDIRGNDLDTNFVEDDPAVKDCQRDLIKASLIRRNGEVFAALSYSASHGDVEEVKRLLKRKANPDASNYDGQSALHFACREGNSRVVEVLIEYGADKNFKNRWGRTPLQVAVFHKQAHVVEILVREGAQLLVDDPAGALCDAASEGNVEYLKLLMDNGVEPDCGDYDSRCPLVNCLL